MRRPPRSTLFPTRRSSDLIRWRKETDMSNEGVAPVSLKLGIDRKSTRLNSSHLGISYAVFCLKKKNSHLYDQEHEANPAFNHLPEDLFVLPLIDDSLHDRL